MCQDSLIGNGYMRVRVSNGAIEPLLVAAAELELGGSNVPRSSDNLRSVPVICAKPRLIMVPRDEHLASP
jgi:hypothetical protein